MGNIIEAFVAFDTSKLRDAVAVADAGRAGEIRFVGEIDNTAVATASKSRSFGRNTSGWPSVMRQGRPDTNSTGSSRALVMSAWWLPPRSFRRNRAIG